MLIFKSFKILWKCYFICLYLHISAKRNKVITNRASNQRLLSSASTGFVIGISSSSSRLVAVEVVQIIIVIMMTILIIIRIVIMVSIINI